jgi:hypothetical protein
MRCRASWSAQVCLQQQTNMLLPGSLLDQQNAGSYLSHSLCSGSFTDTTASMSYTLQNYANDVVSAIQVRIAPLLAAGSGAVLGQEACGQSWAAL